MGPLWPRKCNWRLRRHSHSTPNFFEASRKPLRKSPADPPKTGRGDLRGGSSVVNNRVCRHSELLRIAPLNISSWASFGKPQGQKRRHSKRNFQHQGPKIPQNLPIFIQILGPQHPQASARVELLQSTTHFRPRGHKLKNRG